MKKNRKNKVPPPIDRKAKIVDTSALVHDPFCITYLIQKGVVACIPWTVLEELDGLKSRPDIGFDAREAARVIEEMRQSDQPNLEIVKEINWEKMDFLDRKVKDHMIIATANALQKKYSKVELVSKDVMLRIKAREIGFEAEDYYRDQAENTNDTNLPRVEVTPDKIDMKTFTFPYAPEDHDEIVENGAVVCLSKWDGDMKRPDKLSASGEKFAAIRKNNHFQVIPRNMSIFGIHPYSGLENGTNNWPQNVAMYHLTNPETALVFLEGGAGTGKTLLALAGALEERRRYRNILISRPMVHLEDKDNMGYLPGEIKDKMAPWLRPIMQNLSFLKDASDDNREMIEKFLSEKKIDIEPLDYIRGATFWKCFLIIDEAQNLTPHQVKTIITRAGEGTKIVFTGDLDQIDRKRRLDKRSSGLAYAASRLINQKIVAAVKFQDSVRSELAKMGVEML